MMDLYETLSKKQRHTGFNAGSEMRYFLDHSPFLAATPTFKKYSRAQKPFDIVRANIILRSILNKRKIDETYIAASRAYRRNGEIRHDDEAKVKEIVSEVKKELPCLTLEGGERIFVPILPKSLNQAYDRHPLRFEQKAYKTLLGNNYDMLVVDPFDAYGYKLFDSYFTNWILIREADGVGAFFDYDSLSIYFINSQGRLNATLALFDRGLKKRYTNHMLDRITPVVDAYFRDDREGMYRELVDNQLISSKLIYKIKSDEQLVLSKLDRLIAHD